MEIKYKKISLYTFVYLWKIIFHSILCGKGIEVNW